VSGPGGRTARRWATGGIAVAALVVVVVILSSGGGGPTVRAEFTDARGLLPGNRVTLNGAKVGTVKSISLTSAGHAMVTLQLNSGVEAPRADAAATIRPVDLLGDIYLAYWPGNSAQPLTGVIPVSRTENLPRLSDLLLAFTPTARAGAQALIVALGEGLQDRGVDLDEAALQMRSALAAGDRLTAALSSQNATLGGLIDNAGRMARQLSAHRQDLSQTVTSFSQTLAATARRAPALDRGLTRLAPTISQLGATTRQLADTAMALTPVAVQLGATTPGLTTALQRLGPFLSQARDAVAATRPTLRSASQFLSTAPPALDPLTGGLSAGRHAAPQSNSLLQMLVTATPVMSDALFDNVASEAAEPGNQPADASNDPLRNYWRGAAVLSCQTFGMAIKPGCLTSYLNSTSTAARKRRPAAPAVQPPAPALPVAGPSPRPVTKTPGTRPAADPVSGIVSTATGAVSQVTGAASQLVGTASQAASQATGNATSGVQQLMNYLLGP
jgi:phospholipid/cholesterol/gamma-HCH transport system substrate-binding protein